jgi:hypothetical protein
MSDELLFQQPKTKKTDYDEKALTRGQLRGSFGANLERVVLL